MTTPDTSAVRAWARSNGYDVADRGRLPADVTDAYVAAHGKGSSTAPATGKPTARKAATARPAAKRKATTAPAQKAASRKPADAKQATRTQSAAPSTPPVDLAADRAPATGTRTAPEPKPAPVNDDRRLVALGEQLRALSERVAALEATAGKSNGRPGAKQSRFRRSR